MAIIKQQTPYEFLVRWNNGAVAGAHIRFLERIVEDGITISEKEGDARPVSMAGEAGFPLAEVLNALQVTALSDLAAEKKDKEAADTLLQEAQTALAAALTAKAAELAAAAAAHTSALAVKDATIATLHAQIEAAAASEKEAAAAADALPISAQQAQSLVLALGPTLGLTPGQLEALFAEAKKLQTP